MVLRQQSVDRRGGSGYWPASANKQEEQEAALRQDEEAVISGLRHELHTLRAADPGMSLLTAVEFTTSHADHRLGLLQTLYPEDRSVRSSDMGHDYPRLLKIASCVQNG
jgi:hypothetical protein